MTKEKLGIIYVIFAGVLWGVIGLFSNQLAALGATAIQITESRCLVAAILLLIVICIKDPKLLKIQIKDFWMFIGTGIISIGFFNICYFQCVEMSTLSIACILLYTGPCFVVLLSALLFHEKIGKQQIICLLLSFLGCIFVSGLFDHGNARITGMGFLIGLGSGFFYGLYSIFGHYALQKYSSYTVTVYTFIVASVGLLPFCKPMELLAIYQDTTKVGFDLGVIQTTGTYLILVAILLGIFSTTLPFLFYTKGLEVLDAGKASIFAFIEPMTATIISICVLKEGMTAFSAVGILLIMASVVCMNLKPPSKEH